jgi:hypothetical protein
LPPTVAYASYQVEETLFRVHAYFFVRDSSYFSELLAVHTETDATVTDDKLVRLDEDIKSVDFERFLSILYPPCVITLLQALNRADIMFSEFGKYTLTTLDEWTSVLHLASKWGFESIRTLALRKLLPLASPVDKIVLGRKYGFDDWLTPAFVAVCARAEPLSLEEAKRMDSEDVACIYQAREKARGSSISVPTKVAQEAVTYVFGKSEATNATNHFDKDDTGDRTSSTTDNVDLNCERVCTGGASPEPLATNVPADDVEVDDGLMEALATWSRICSQFDNSSFDHLPTGYYVRCGYPLYPQYVEYKADYERLLTYLGGQQLQSTSLRHFLSVALQSGLNRTRGAFCTQLYTDLHNRINKDSPDFFGISAHAMVGEISLTHMVNQLCLELVTYECSLEDTSDPFGSRHRPACLVTNLMNANLLTNATLRACFTYLIPALVHPDTWFLLNMSTFLTSHGKTFDHESCRDLMDNIFVQLRKHALEWRCQSAHKDIVVSSHYQYKLYLRSR